MTTSTSDGAPVYRFNGDFPSDESLQEVNKSRKEIIERRVSRRFESSDRVSDV